MSPYTSFAIVGAGGLGAHIARAFAALPNAAKLKLKVITRKQGGALKPLPLIFRIAAVDYSSSAELEAALADVDVVISALSAGGLALQPAIAEAAKAAGVKHFIPSEYGMVTDSYTSGPLFGKTQFQATLRKLELPYTLFYNGAFTEMLINAPFLEIHFPTSINLVTPGDVQASWTAMVDIGRYVAYYLSTTDSGDLATIVRIESDRMSMLELVRIYEETHPGAKVDVTYTSQDVMKERLEANEYDFAAFLRLALATGGVTVGEVDGKNLWPEWNPTPARDFIARLE